MRSSSKVISDLHTSPFPSFPDPDNLNPSETMPVTELTDEQLNEMLNYGSNSYKFLETDTPYAVELSNE